MCNRSFAHCALHMQCMDFLNLSHIISCERYVLYSDTSKFRGCRITMQKSKLLKTIRIRCGKWLCGVPCDNSAKSLIQNTVCLKEVKGKWTVQSQKHFPLLCYLETLLHKVLCGKTLLTCSENRKHFLTNYK